MRDNDHVDPIELRDDELSTVSGGMTCRQAYAAANLYEVLGGILANLGYPVKAAGMYGRAIGVRQGACT